MKRIINITLIVLTLVLGTSCDDDFLERFPKDGPADVTFLQTEVELNMAVNGTYRSLWLHHISASGQWEHLLDMSTDIAFDRNLDIFQLVAQGNLSATNLQLKDIWTRLYAGIAKANFVIQNIDRVQGVSQQNLDLAVSQVRFLRAYWYSQLITLWGDVPLVKTTVGIGDESNLTRTSKSEIETFLIAELEEISQKLPDTWGTKAKSQATKGAALALLSRVALNAGKHDVVISAARRVIDSNTYKLYPNYEELFNLKGESNSEVIFEIEFLYGINHHRLPISLGSRTAQCNSTKVPTQALVDSYECIDGLTIDESPLYNSKEPFKNRDPRLRQTIVLPGDIFLGYQFESHRDSIRCWNYRVFPPTRVTNQDAVNPFATFTGYLFRKMADSTEIPDLRNFSSLNAIVLRYGEVLLNFAEAKIEKNEIDQECLNAINMIRSRESVKMPAVEFGKTQGQMRKIIRRERKIELAFEGLRLQDIRRWGIAEKVLSGPLIGRPNSPYSYKDQGIPVFDENGHPNYSAFQNIMRIVEVRSFSAPRDYLWPIPQSEIDINSNMTQNLGY